VFVAKTLMTVNKRLMKLKQNQSRTVAGLKKKMVILYVGIFGSIIQKGFPTMGKEQGDMEKGDVILDSC